ncbi:hypothetical protein BXZ70DRAFT_951211 [Cristinia sonorae]|uniref:F-box domain-containing protein n=1 Tax=Cristinia sonorae TaxID=1940300 RepID=A0A8K0UHT6_9AGAR|nr:hypothetical protein BXZ70DRAFT_951211 [Cristinia sonorae]
MAQVDLSNEVPMDLDSVSLHSVFLEKIVCNNIIHDVIIFYLTPLEFLRLSRTCKLVHSIVRSYIKRTFNINRFLSRFFTDPVSFRALQARTGTLISGSSALQFFDRTFYPKSDLDLYLQPFADREVAEWLFLDGFKFVPNATQPNDWEDAIEEATTRLRNWNPMYPSRSIHAVFDFSKPSPHDPKVTLIVQCMVSQTTPIEIIMLFHSTCVMNVISWEKAYSLYPVATLHERRSLISVMDKDASGGQAAAMVKYAERGFEMLRHIIHRMDVVDPSFPTTPRFMGDGMCWTLPLDLGGLAKHWRVTGELATPLKHDPVSATSWQLQYQFKKWLTQNFVKVEYTVIRRDYLHRAYLTLSDKPIDYAEQTLRRDMEFRRDLKGIQKLDYEFIKYCLEFYRLYAERRVRRI